MTLDQWLREATGMFPKGVQTRLAQEYRAHLEESVAAGDSRDVESLFGQPDTVRRQLKKSYAVSKQLADLNYIGERPFWFGTAMWLGILLFGLTWMSSSQALFLLAVGCAFGTSLLIATYRWTKLRRNAFRGMSTMIFFIFLNTYNCFLGEKTSILYGFYFLATGFYLIRALFKQDIRLRRTLELEGQP
jgi:hypothetical protein